MQLYLFTLFSLTKDIFKLQLQISPFLQCISSIFQFSYCADLTFGLKTFSNSFLWIWCFCIKWLRSSWFINQIVLWKLCPMAMTDLRLFLIFYVGSRLHFMAKWSLILSFIFELVLYSLIERISIRLFLRISKLG